MKTGCQLPEQNFSKVVSEGPEKGAWQVVVFFLLGAAGLFRRVLNPDLRRVFKLYLSFWCRGRWW